MKKRSLAIALLCLAASGAIGATAGISSAIAISTINTTAVIICLLYAFKCKRLEFAIVVSAQIMAYSWLQTIMPENPTTLAVNLHYFSVSTLLAFTAHSIQSLKTQHPVKRMYEHIYVLCASLYALLNILCIIVDVELVYTMHDIFGSMFILIEVATCLLWTHKR